MINETIGWIGNILFAICGIPQVIKTYRSKSVKDLSSLFLWFWFAGELLTFVYILVGDMETGLLHFPLYFNYVANTAMACFLIYAKYFYPQKYKAPNS
ncbi:MAG: PQ-loop repeat-containing protein [Draconibacterium sp.]